MPILPSNKWPDTELARHYILFAQTVQLLLNENAFESFRAPVLDNLTRLSEFIHLCDLVLHRELPQGHLKPVASELIEYLGSDSVAKSIIGPTFEHFIASIKAMNISDFGEISRNRNASALNIRKLELYYDDRLQSDLISSLLDRRHKIALQELSRVYISRLLNRGFDRRFIKLCLNEVFFGGTIKKVGPHLIKRFAKKFPQHEREFTVYVPVKKTDALSLRKFPSFFHVLKRQNELPKGLASIINNDDRYSNSDMYFEHSLRGIDCFSATASVQQLVTTYPSLTVLEDRGLDVQPRTYAFARQKGGRKYQVVEDQKLSIQPSVSTISATKGKSLTRNLESVLTHFDGSAISRILTALKAVSLARQTDMAENQIILIWSAIETLLGDPPRGSTRLKYYRSSIIPAVCLNYCWRYSKAVYSQVEYHNRKALQHALDEAQIEGGISPHRRFQYLIFHPQNRKFHRILMEGLADNPSLTHLVFRFYRRFGQGPSLRKHFHHHETRVSWQIDRIYRARNEFIHSGRSRNYTDRLSINAFEYFRTTLQAMLYHAFQISVEFGDVKKASIEEIRESLRICHELRVKHISSANQNDDAGISEYLSIFVRM